MVADVCASIRWKASSMRNVLNSGSLSVRDLSEELNTASNTRDNFPAVKG